MRLRLLVLRHELPPTRLLWQASPEQTISELLSQLNDPVPLEAEGWGLEDYAVQVGGYECLHYQKIGDILKDEDEVTIQSLQTNDVRARYITGRSQITADGRHLIDGVAFGRPKLRRSARPTVHIPARRDATPLLEESASFAPPLQSTLPHEGLHNEERVTFMDLMNDLVAAQRRIGEPEDDEDDEDDEDFLSDDEDEEFTMSEEDQLESEDCSSQSEASWTGINSGTVTPNVVAQTALALVLNGDDSSSYSSSSDSSSVSSSSDDTSSDDASSSDDLTDSRPAIAAESLKRKPSASGGNTEQPPAKRAKVTGDAHLRNKPSAASGHQGVSSTPKVGMKKTTARNKRRVAAKRLAYLKKTGVLPSDSTMEYLRKWQAAHDQGVSTEQSEGENGKAKKSDDVAGEKSSSESESETSSSISAPSEQGIHEPPAKEPANRQLVTTNGEPPDAKSNSSKAEDFEAKRKALLDAIAGGGVEMNEDEDSIVARPISVQDESPAPADDTPKSRRAKLDLAGSQRLLFGSLGVRTPKTAADREKLQKKLAAQGLRKPIPIADSKASTEDTSTGAANEETVTDPDAWKSKINLMAVECCEEDVELSTPPFPFYQRWDPAQWGSKKRKRNSSAYIEKNGKNKNEKSYYFDGEDDTLDYDDIAEDDNDNADAEEQLLNETAKAVIEDDLPPLPADPSSLPPINDADIAVGDIIVFSKLEVSAETNWQPAQSPVRTALVLDVDNEGVDLRLAKRDLPEKEYDDQGNRVYRKFEMQLDNEDDEAFLSVGFVDLYDPRLLGRVAVADSHGESNGHGEVNGHDEYDHVGEDDVAEHASSDLVLGEIV